MNEPILKYERTVLRSTENEVDDRLDSVRTVKLGEHCDRS